MASRKDTIRKMFHTACAQAVEATFGKEWGQLESSRASWASMFSNHTSPLPRLLVLTFSERQHIVEVDVAAWRVHAEQPTHLPPVWWEDRRLHPNEPAYRKIFWKEDIAYRSEDSVRIPRQVWSSEFLDSLKEGLAQIQPKVQAWFEVVATEAESGPHLTSGSN